jgi:hypothetical protein
MQGLFFVLQNHSFLFFFAHWRLNSGLARQMLYHLSHSTSPWDLLLLLKNISHKIIPFSFVIFSLLSFWRVILTFISIITFKLLVIQDQ